jgi:hypothetical protein
MDAHDDRLETRRDCLRALARGAALGGLAVLAAALLLKRGRGGGAAACDRRGPCRGCPRLAGCEVANHGNAPVP